MKHLRRNRSTSVSSPSSSSPPVSAPTALSPAAAARAAADRTRGSPDTPLYARFTSARRGHDGSAPALKPLVSGPLALGPKKPAQAPPLVAPPLQQQKSSESRKERERRRDGERAEASGTPRSEKMQRELSKEEGERDGGRNGNRNAEGGESDGGPDRQQVRRMQSDGTALSAGSASAGLHGTRVEGERVLLPARKVTQKRAGGDKPAVDRAEEKPAEKGTERSADRSRPARDGGGEGKDEVRAVGERVLLPARKVTRKRVPVEESESAASSPNDRPRPTLLESSRTDSGGASTSSSSRSARANELSKTRTGAVERAQARATSPEPQASSSSPRRIAFPAANANASPSPAPGVSAAASPRTAAVVVVHPDGGEDQFSTPKRARMHTLATTTPASRHVPREPAPIGNDPCLTSPVPSTSAGTGSATASGPPPRRRKYSLRAAFGLPDPAPRNPCESDAGTSTSTSAATSHAKPPTPTARPPPRAPSPQPAPSPSPLPDGARAPAPAPEPTSSQVAEPKSSEAHLGVHSPAISPAPRDHRRAGPPESLLQLQSLHLSGFNFSLDALLAGDDAARDSPQAESTPAPPPPLPVPPVPAAVIDVHPPSPEQLGGRLGDVPAEQPSLSDPPARHEERAVKQFASSSPSPDESKPGERQRSPVAVAFDIPARPAPIPVQPPQPSQQQQQPPPPPRQHSRQHSQSQPRPAPKHAATVTESSQKLHKYIPRTIDLDHSLLPPESDTRYPITRRRSPTAPTPVPSAPKPSASKPKRPGPAPEMPRQMSPPRPDYPPTQRGPVQGRPLIFAAMAAAEAEAELIDPKAWMAVATLEPDAHPTPERPPLAEHSDGSSQFVNGYPTPRSTSPKSLEPHERSGKQETSAADRSVAAPAADSPHAHARERETATRRASPPNTQSPPSAPAGLPTPTEPEPRPRARKLSKSRSRIARAPEPSQQPTPTSSQQQPQKSSTLGAKPPTPVEDPPPPPRTQERGASTSRHTSQPSQTPASASTHGGVVHAPAPASAVAPASAAALGSPIQLRLEKPLPERRSAESIRSPPPPRVISSESPVPRRPVKMLTERQMEKLSATKGFAPVPSGSGAPGGPTPAQAARRRHEHPVPVSSPPSQSRSLPSQRPVAPEELKARTVHTSDDAVQAVSRSQSSEDPASVASPQQTKSPLPQSPPHRPVSPEDYAHARTRRRGKPLEKSRPEGIESVAPAADPIPDPPVDAAAQDSEPAAEPEEPKEPTFYPLEKHVAEPALLAQLLGYLAFSDWLAVSSTSKTIRARLHERELSELVLERYLRTVGYARWAFVEPEPLSLTLTDLNAYMHGVSLPPHMFARHAETYLQAENRDRNRRLRALVSSLQSACRSYTRVVLRLRAQAEAEARANASAAASPTSPLRGRALPSVKSTTSVNNVPVGKKTFSRSSSRAPSPTSSWNHSYGHGRAPSLPGQSSAAPSISGHGAGGTGVFHSPLFRLRRAPLLQVFVPSPDGEWLSDASVIECEKELKRAGVVNLLRPGDVIWDTAVGDEGNLGRLVWDGGYLIDLDYTYSRAGDLPKYLPTLAFPPSYFHRVVRTMGNGNPICHIDIAPWGEEVAANLQLLQDRMKAETPQGGHHMVVRWVHRSSFTIRPQPGGKPLRLAVPRDVGPGPGPGGAWFVDPGWLGTVVVEAEGTNEGLADLQARCRGAFPPRAQGAPLSPERAARAEAQKSVFRILREKSRPGEIWIRTVTEKERLLPP